jgi:hypothetical protein
MGSRSKLFSLSDINGKEEAKLTIVTQDGKKRGRGTNPNLYARGPVQVFLRRLLPRQYGRESEPGLPGREDSLQVKRQ